MEGGKGPGIFAVSPVGITREEYARRVHAVERAHGFAKSEWPTHPELIELCVRLYSGGYDPYPIADS